MVVGLPEGPSYFEHSLYTRHFSLFCPRKEGQLFSLFFCLSLDHLLLLTKGNIHPNLGHRLSSFSVRWKCDVEGYVVAMLHLLHIDPFKLLTALIPRILGSSHNWSCPPTLTNIVSSSSDSSNFYTSTIPPDLPLLMQCSRTILTFKPPTLLLPILYFFSLHAPHPVMFLTVFLYFLLPFPSLLSHDSSMESRRSLTLER